MAASGTPASAERLADGSTGGSHVEPIPIADAVGRTYTSAAPYALGRAKIAEFAAALGDANPAYHSVDAARAFGHADVVAPPTFPVVVTFGLLDQVLNDPELGFALHRVIHADQRFSLIRPLVAGDELVARLVIDRARRMGEADMVFTRTELTTVEGEPVGEAGATILHQATPSEDVRAVASGTPGGTPSPSSPSAHVPAYDDVRKGMTLPDLAVPLRRADLVRYAGASGDFNPIHWSDRVAETVGLPGVIAHGMLTMAQAARVVTDWVADPGRVQEYSTRFSKPILVPDDDQGVALAAAGTVAELLDDRRVRVDLSATVGADEVLGRARAVVRLG